MCESEKQIYKGREKDYMREYMRKYMKDYLNNDNIKDKLKQSRDKIIKCNCGLQVKHYYYYKHLNTQKHKDIIKLIGEIN